LFNKIDVVQDEEILDELENKFLEDISKKIFLTKDCIKSNIVKISAA
jgi:translation elongation factor EF-Tu-like GTPase